jgi:hypothetical protein
MGIGLFSSRRDAKICCYFLHILCQPSWRLELSQALFEKNKISRTSLAPGA